MTDTERAEYDDVVRQLVAKCEQLAAENARLRSSENTAHSVLREVYNDPTASPAVRVKAAGLALPHETPRLAPVEAPMELVAEPYEPLAVVVERQRARARVINALPLSEREKLVRGVTHESVAIGHINSDGNGHDDSSGD
jgi:hypothetical protein